MQQVITAKFCPDQLTFERMVAEKLVLGIIEDGHAHGALPLTKKKQKKTVQYHSQVNDDGNELVQ